MENVMCRAQGNRNQKIGFQPQGRCARRTGIHPSGFLRLDSGDRNGRDRNGLESAASKERQATPLTRGHSRAACLGATAQPASKGDKMTGINHSLQGSLVQQHGAGSS